MSYYVLPTDVAEVSAARKTEVTETTPLPVFTPANIISVTLSLDTSAYASGDLIADTQEIDNAVQYNAATAILDSLTIIDVDAQGVAFDVYITNTSTSFGTENSAPNISDANLVAGIAQVVSVAAADYKTVSGAKIATLRNLGLVCEAAAASRDLYVAVVNSTGTPTYTASGMVFVFGFRW